MSIAFILLPTGSPLTKLGQFWPLLTSPGLTKCYLTAKSSLQHSIHIFRKSQKKLATFPINFFRGITKVWEGGCFSPPPAPDRVNQLRHVQRWANDPLFTSPQLWELVNICSSLLHSRNRRKRWFGNNLLFMFDPDEWCPQPFPPWPSHDLVCRPQNFSHNRVVASCKILPKDIESEEWNF